MAGVEGESVGLVIAEKFTIPGASEIEVMSMPSSDFTQGKAWLVESEQYPWQSGVMVARAVVSPSSRKIPIRLLNPQKEPIELGKGIKVAQMEALVEEPPLQSPNPVVLSAVTEVPQDKEEALWKMVSSNDHLSEYEKVLLYALLLEYADVFRLHAFDIGRTNLIN